MLTFSPQLLKFNLMPNQELISYIKKEQQKGLDKTTIVNSLLNVGWQQTQIDEAFVAISPQMPSQQQSPTAQRTYVPIKDYPQIITVNNSKSKLMCGIIFMVILILLGISATVLFAYDKLPIKNYDLQNKIANILMSIPFMSKNNALINK